MNPSSFGLVMSFPLYLPLTFSYARHTNRTGSFDAEESTGLARKNYDKRLLKTRQPNTQLSGYAWLNEIV